MSDSITYLTPIIPDPNWQKFVTAAALAGGLVVVGRALTSRIATQPGLESAVVPDPKLTGFGFFDFFVEAFVAHHDSVLGRENRKHVPFTGSIFLFVLFANFIGLIPGFPAPTTTVWINVGMALVVFFHFNYQGIKEHGPIAYLKHFGGPVWWLFILIFPLEIFSTLLRILTLNLRLYWNITADHLVLHTFTGLGTEMGFPFLAVPFYALGTFVCFMQAFVFTTLTMVYIFLATQHEEGEHH